MYPEMDTYNKNVKSQNDHHKYHKSKSSSAERYVGTVGKTGREDVKKVDVNYFKIMLQTKDEQIEKFIQKITDLQLYNTQFAEDNDRLINENCHLKNSITNLNRKLEEIQNRECEICKNWEKEKQDYLQNNQNLTEDVIMLKTLVHRLNVQLERYQDKFREIISNNQNNNDEQSQQQQNISPMHHLKFHYHHHIQNSNDNDAPYDWGNVNHHTLGPLLNAYEEIIKEKEYLLEQYENELNHFTGQFKKIITENTILHEQMNDLQQINDKWKNEKIQIQAQLNVYRSKAEIQTKRADLAKEKLSEILHCYEQKVQSQALDLERLQDAYSRAKGEIITLKNIQQQSLSQSKSSNNEILDENIKECQKLFEELKIQYNNERKNLSEELIEIKKSNTQLENKLSTIQTENSSLKNDFDDIKHKNIELIETIRKLKESRDRFKLRLRSTLQWVKKLENNKEKIQNTWSHLKELEAIIGHKDAQIRGLQARYTIEIEKLQEKLQQKDQTIRKILKEKVEAI